MMQLFTQAPRLACALFVCAAACLPEGDGASTTGGGAAGAPLGAVPCENPQPVIVEGQATGYEHCDRGFTHRPAVMDCPLGQPPERLPACVSGDNECTQHAECPELPYGWCQFSAVGCKCSYGCANDTECIEAICVCGTPYGTCTPAACTSDADCGGALCTTYQLQPCGDDVSAVAWACQSELDECAGFEDCPTGKYCVLVNGHRECRGNCTDDPL
jgi:hypothetical protein